LASVQIKEYNIYASRVDDIEVENTQTIINTINAHSYITAKKDGEFKKALIKSDILLPDGEGIVFMVRALNGVKITKVAGADIHEHLLNLANNHKLKCFYLGASESTLDLIKQKIATGYPNICLGSYSPPFKPVFSQEDNTSMIKAVNDFSPHILFVGMTAPKQEKWVFENSNKINAKVICSIGAVFDFVAETKKRAPQWVINIKMEWFYRSFTAWRLTKRYAYSTPLFIFEVIKLKYFSKHKKHV